MTDLADLAMHDCVWLASDIEGRLAVLVTAGEGPVPPSARDGIDVFALEEDVLSLAPVGTAKILVEVPDPSSFAELAARGLFVYDWTDAHRVQARQTGAYEAVAIPSTPRRLEDLPAPLRDIAGRTRLDLDFRVASTVKV